jgi:hypothetical protein
MWRPIPRSAGKARMRAGTEDRAVGRGTLVFVAAKVEHRAETE